jgi:hypothetical protein
MYQPTHKLGLSLSTETLRINHCMLRKVSSIGFFALALSPLSLLAQTEQRGICGNNAVTPCIEQPTGKLVKGRAAIGATIAVKLNGMRVTPAPTVDEDGAFSIDLDQPLKQYDVIEIDQSDPPGSTGPISVKAQPDQTCAKGKPPCIDQPHEGDTQVTGKIALDETTGKAPDGVTVSIKVGTESIPGSALVKEDGTFSKPVNLLSQHDKVEADETINTIHAATIGPVPVLKPASTTSDTTSSLYTLGLAGIDVTGTSASGPKQQYFAEFDVVSPLHWLGRACWSPETKPTISRDKQGNAERDSSGNLKMKMVPRTENGRTVRNDEIYPLAGRCWVWLDPRIASVPTTTSTALSSITSASLAGSGSQTIAAMTQSFEFHGGGELYVTPPSRGALFGSGDSWAKTTVSMIWGAGMTTPFNATTGSPEYGLSGNLAQQFNQDPTLAPQYPVLASALCSYGFSGSTTIKCPNPLPSTKPTIVAFVFPNRTRFYRDFFGGIRLRTFYFKGTCSKPSNAEIATGKSASNLSDTNQACLPTNTFPGTFDVRFGEDESVSGGHLVPLVMTLTGSYPLPGTGGALRVFGASYLRLHRNQNSTALVLIPTATFTTLDTSTVIVQPIQPSDQDYYRLGIGVDLVALIHKFWSSQQTQTPKTTGSSGSAPPTAATP